MDQAEHDADTPLVQPPKLTTWSAVESKTEEDRSVELGWVVLGTFSMPGSRIWVGLPTTASVPPPDDPVMAGVPPEGRGTEVPERAPSPVPG